MYGSIQQKQFLLSQRKRGSVNKFILLAILKHCNPIK
jgi:hypothetical protein